MLQHWLICVATICIDIAKKKNASRLARDWEKVQVFFSPYMPPSNKMPSRDEISIFFFFFESPHFWKFQNCPWLPPVHSSPALVPFRKILFCYRPEYIFLNINNYESIISRYQIFLSSQGHECITCLTSKLSTWQQCLAGLKLVNIGLSAFS